MLVSERMLEQRADMQSQKWVLILVILNLGLLYGVVKKWHANEVDQLKGVALGAQSSAESKSPQSPEPDPGRLTMSEPAQEAIRGDRANRSQIGSEVGTMAKVEESNPDGGRKPFVEAPVQQTNTCAFHGPLDFTGSSVLPEAVESLLSLAVLKGDYSYRLVTEGLKDKEAAKSIVKRLRSKGIDSFFMTQGPFTDRISLGIFKARQTAVDLRLSRMKLQEFRNLPIEIVPDVSRWPQWWVSSNNWDAFVSVVPRDLNWASERSSRSIAPCEQLEFF